MKHKNIFLIIGLGILILTGIEITGCSATKDIITIKSGAQLWGETCARCHNAPSPETFSDVEWDVAILHMQVRAKLTEEESKKIVEFLKIAN